MVKGRLKVRVVKGTNLVMRDQTSSDPYVIIELGPNEGKTSVKKKTLNPEWNEDLIFPIMNLNTNNVLKVVVWDKDTFMNIDRLDPDDYMGEAQLDLKPLFAKETLVRSGGDNCLDKDSSLYNREGKVVQDVVLKLRNVESGLLNLQLTWPV